VTRLALFAGPDPGHALPMLGLGAALVRRGVEVRCWTGRSHRPSGTAVGVDVRDLPMLPPSDQDVDLGHRFWGRAVQMAPLLEAALREWRPDAVVTDTLLRAGGLAAQLIGVPAVEVVGHHLPDPADDLPPVGLGRRRPRTALGRAHNRSLVHLQRRSVASGRVQGQAAAAALGLDAPRPPAIRLLATLPGLERPRSTWPADAHVVGPLAIDPALPDLEPPEGDRPLVVVTDTTASGVSTTLGRVALDALPHLDVRLVVTSSDLPPSRRAGVVVGAGPHRPLLEQAAVAVGPGGGGFLSKATAAGVPLVVVPIQGDQREAAARLRDTGAGVRLRPGHLAGPLGERRLAWAVARMLADPAAHRAAGRLADEAAGLGPELAATLVVRVAHGQRPRARGPAEHLYPSRSGIRPA
jgi:UDP:flavonoid glycosyltransferase YjiC (YdhE family)